MLDERAREARPAILLLVALAALGWVCAFYALWLDAGHRVAAQTAISRLEAENRMLREALAPLNDLAQAESDPALRGAADSAPQRTGTIVVAEATSRDFAERDRLEAEIERLAGAETAMRTRVARAVQAESDASARRIAQEEAVAALEEHVLSLRDDLVRLDSQIRATRRDLADLEREREERRAAADAIAADIARAQAEGSVAREAVEAARATLAETEEARAAEEAALSAARSRLAALEAEIAAAEERIDLREAALGSLEERLARAADAVRAAEQAAGRAAERMSATPAPQPPSPPPAPEPATAPAPAPMIETRPDGLRVIRVPVRP